jgi:hypothetical protein
VNKGLVQMQIVHRITKVFFAMFLGFFSVVSYNAFISTEYFECNRSSNTCKYAFSSRWRQVEYQVPIGNIQRVDVKTHTERTSKGTRTYHTVNLHSRSGEIHEVEQFLGKQAQAERLAADLKAFLADPSKPPLIRSNDQRVLGTSISAVCGLAALLLLWRAWKKP